MAKSKSSAAYVSKGAPNRPLEDLGKLVSPKMTTSTKVVVKVRPKPESRSDDYLTLISLIGRAHDMALGLGLRIKKAKKQSEKLDLLLERLVARCNRTNYSEVSSYLQRRIAAMEGGHLYTSTDSRELKTPGRKNQLTPNQVKKLYQDALDKINTTSGAKTYSVKWEKVRFENGALRATTPEGTFACSFSQSRQSYNLFISAIVERVPPLKVRVFKIKPAEILKTADLSVVFQFLAIKDAVKNNDTGVLMKLPSLLEGLPKQYQQLFLPEGRNEYIKFLVEKQADDYRFIPVFEHGADIDDAYLFTILGKRLLIVWENLSPNTATFVFPCTKNNYKEVLQRIYDYACSDVAYKRMRLHPNSLDPIIGLKYDILYHNDFELWKEQLNNL